MIKKIRENKFFSEKGSVTLFILIAIIFFLIVSLNVYSSNKNKIIAQAEEIKAIEENYNKNIENMDEIYDNLIKAELKTVFIKQSSINSPNKVEYNLSDWTNENVIVKVTIKSESNPDAQLQVKVTSKKTGNTITYNKSQIDNNEVIITENSTVVVTLEDKEQRFELTKFDKENPVLSYESFFTKNNAKYTSGTWTNKETYTKISVIEEISGITEMYYSTDKQNWTKLNFSQSNGIYQEANKYCGKETWVLKDGRIEDIYFRAKDRAGNYSNISNVYQIRYDTTTPTKPIIENEYNDIWTNKDVEVIAKSSDSLSKIKEIEYSYNEIDWKTDWKGTLQSNGNEASISSKWDTSFNGNIYIRAIDNAENISETSYTSIKQDVIAPTVNVTPNGNTYYVPEGGKTTIRVKLDAVDNESGLHTLEYAWSTSNTVEPSKWETFENGKEITKINATSGTYYLWTNVIDNVGNRASKIKVSNPFIVSSNQADAFKITIDTNPNVWTKDSVNATITYGYGLTQGKKAGMGASISEAQKVANENTANQLTVINNNYYIYAEAMDSSGNKVNATKQVTNIDKIAPTKPEITNSSQGNLTNKNVEVTVTSQDTQSGIDYYEWFENNAWTTRALTTTNGVGKITFTTDRKNHTIKFRAVDKVGNISEESTTIINLDKTAPVLSPITNSSNGNWTNQKVDLSWTITENGSEIQKVQYSYDGNQWNEDLPKNEWYGLSRNNERNDIIYIRAIDAAGNISNVSSTNIKIDKTLPTVELEKNGGTYNIAQNSSFVPITTKITAQDNGGSGLNNLQYQISDSTTLPTDDDPNWKTFTNESSVTENKTGGTWYLYTKVTDKAGNRAIHIQKSNPYVVNYSVTYDANGGTGTMPTDSVLYNTPYTTRENAFSKVGHTFKGWNEKADGTGIDWTNRIGKPWTWTYNKSITLYAQWTPNQYTLTVNPNGGTWNGTTENSSFTQNYGSTKEITNPTAPAGYKVNFDGNGGTTPAAQNSTKSFTSWTTGGSGSLSGTTYTFGAGNGTLTANYKNNSITLPSTTKAGYTFAGWYDAASGGNKVGDAGATYIPTEAKTLYAHWTTGEYTLTVNPNGGTWNGTTESSTFKQGYGTTKEIANPTAPAGYTVTFNGNGGTTPAAQNSTKSFTNWTNSGSGTLSGTTYTFGAGNGTLTANYKNNSITLPSTTKAGYTFEGWYDAVSGGNKIGDAGATYTPTSAKTLYAHWTINSYTLTVNPNGGTWNGTTGNSTFTQNYGSTKEIANPTAPVGYKVTFNGNGGSTPAVQTSTKSFTSWTTGGSGSLSGTTYTFGAGNGTLTANYKNNAITLPSTSRTGYIFAGWYDAASGGNKVGDAGATYTPTEAKTLYAHWTTGEYTLTVNPNGGTWNGTTGSSTFKQGYGTTKEIANPTAPVGYKVTFNGNGGSTPAAQNSTKSFTNWTNSGSGTLSGTTYTFGAGNGTLTANYKNNSITLPSTTKAGYTFEGWYDAVSGGNKIGDAGATYTPTSAKTLYAHWTINSYTLTVNPNGGTWNGTTSSSSFTQNYGSTKTIANPTAPAGYTVTFNGNGGSTPATQTSTKSFTNWSNSGAGTLSGTTYIFGAGNGTLTANYKNNSITLPSTTKTGYTFEGWYDAVNGGNKIGNAGATYTPTSAKTLYAHWTVNSYTLTVNPNGGTWNGTTSSSTFTQNYGSTKVISNPTAPTGYKVTFNGNGGSTPAAQNSTKSFTSWTTGGSGSLSGTTYTFGAGNGTLTANYRDNSITLPSSSRTGYTFEGWYDSAYGGNKIGNAGATYTPTSAKTLYAHWTANQYTLTVNPNGGSWNGSYYNSTFRQSYGTTKTISNPIAPTGYTVTFNGNGGSTPYSQTSTKSFTSWSNSGAGSFSGTTYTFGAGDGTLTANYRDNSITLPSSSRTGYTFEGWYDSAYGGNKIGNAGATYTPTSAKTLYAHWTANQYTLTVNPNGGSWNGSYYNSTFRQSYGTTKTISNPMPPSGNTVYFDGNGGSTPSSQTSTKSFTSWSNSGAGSFSGTTYTFGAGDGTLTANYNDNSITLPSSSRTGYTFEGWYDAASGGNKIGNAGTWYTPTSSKTLYAHWTANQYTLTVNPNGGTWNGTTGSSTFTQNYASTKTIANPTAPTGYKVTFNGNGGSTPAAQNSTKSFTNWTNSGSGTLSGTTYTFGAGSGTLTANYKNNSITLPSTTKEGYTFEGWYDSASGGNKIGNAGATYTPTSTKTLYAHWTAKKLTVTFMRNTSATDNTSTTQTFTYGVTGQKFSNKGWSKTNYKMLGWNINRTATTAQYTTLSGVTDGWIDTHSPSITIFAIWAPDPRITITDQPDNQTVVAGNKYRFSISTDNGRSWICKI